MRATSGRMATSIPMRGNSLTAILGASPPMIRSSEFSTLGVIVLSPILRGMKNPFFPHSRFPASSTRNF